MAIVTRALSFTALVLIALGAYLVASSRQPLVGVLVLCVGVLDGLMAFALSRRT